MCYQEKLERADNQLKSLGLSCNTDKTILYRFLRKQGFKLKPVYYESFFKNVVLKFTEFFIVYFSITYLFSLAQDGVSVMVTLANAFGVSSVFAIAMSIYYLLMAKKSLLTDWERL
ncbi:DUF6404 family protein [Vibrio cionasavignyae]|uniref:DUF6404 family protein n=1 Tax=Vibrio cionasavignyae TaxID=2910252 RepID=UPI003D0D4F2C